MHKDPLYREEFTCYFDITHFSYNNLIKILGVHHHTMWQFLCNFPQVPLKVIEIKHYSKSFFKKISFKAGVIVYACNPNTTQPQFPSWKYTPLEQNYQAAEQVTSLFLKPSYCFFNLNDTGPVLGFLELSLCNVSLQYV